ncbi:MAG: flippase [Desulfobacteraceae bacterium]|nr:flippase [Desulfobacteraceae bacterium]
MNTAQRIIKNTASLLFLGIISQLIGFAAVIYLARVLGPGGFGKINFAIAIITYFTLIANMGLPLLGTREIAREKDKIKDYIGNILILRLCLALLGFCLLLLLAFFLNKPLEIKYLIIFYGFGLIPSALLLDWAFQGVEKMEYIGLGNILATAIYVVLVLSFVKSPEQILLIPCFQVAGSLLAAAILFSIFAKNFGKPVFKIDLVFWKSLIRQSLPIGFSLIMAQIFYNIDTVMLGFMRSDEEVGYYNAAYKIIMLFIFVIGVYHDAIFPVISNYYKTSLDSLRKLLSVTQELMVAVAVPLAVGGTILARPIINLLYGTDYNNGIIAFQILIWAVVIIYINTAYSRGLLACKKENWFLAGTIIPAVVNVVANFILIPPLGLKGAAISTVIAEASGFLVMYIGFKKIFHMPFHNYIVRPLLASSLMLIFLYWGLNSRNLNIVSLIIGGALIYSGLFYLMRGVNREEIALIKSALLGGKN